MPDVRIWRLRLGDDPDVASLWDVLSVPEQACARAIRSRADRERYVAGRGALRRILGACRGESPGNVVLLETATGKPATEGFEFSVSYARNDFVCAVTRGEPLGIDIEAATTLPDLDDLLFVCSRRESELIRAQREPRRSATFLRLWTRKEAVLKAAGLGLGSLAPREVETLGGSVRIAADWWRLTDLRLSGVVASLATRGRRTPTFDIVEPTKEPKPD